MATPSALVDELDHEDVWYIDDLSPLTDAEFAQRYGVVKRLPERRFFISRQVAPVIIKVTVVIRELRRKIWGP